MSNILGGVAEVSFNEVTIPASLLSEVAVELPEGTRERSTLAGNFTRPSGTIDNPKATFTMYLPSIDYLKNIFPGRYNDPSGTQQTGNIVWSTDTCGSVDAGPVNIHYICNSTDDNDVFFYAGLAQLNFNPTYNNSDELTIEVTIHAQPDTDGNVFRLGTGDLTQPSVWDAEAGDTVAVTS